MEPTKEEKKPVNSGFDGGLGGLEGLTEIPGFDIGGGKKDGGEGGDDGYIPSFGVGTGSRVPRRRIGRI